MPRERKKKDDSRATLEMTPMIDVVFQLLIFFIVTLKQNDITSYLDAMRPQPDPNPQPTAEEPITIAIGPRFTTFEGREVTEATLRTGLQRIARMNPNTTIVIKCTEDSQHGKLVRALDICNQVGLRKLAVFSM